MENPIEGVCRENKKKKKITGWARKKDPQTGWANQGKGPPVKSPCKKKKTAGSQREPHRKDGLLDLIL